MVLDRSNTGFVGSNPARNMDVRVFLCCAILCRLRPWDGPIPVQGILSKCLNGFTVTEVHSESEQPRGTNP
jgi:hypothetical protein